MQLFMYIIFITGHYFICRPSCISGQYESSMDITGVQDKILPGDYQGMK